MRIRRPGLQMNGFLCQVPVHASYLCAHTYMLIEFDTPQRYQSLYMLFVAPR